MINALSIDLEYWWSIELLSGYHLEQRDDLVYESIYPMLNLLDKYNTNATFFVLGSLAERYPELIEEIYSSGHEIASHSYSHKTLYELGATDFEKELRRSKNLLYRYNPIGFRAPSFSIDNSTRWALDILVKCGFKYDSSIFPMKTMLYGVANAPLCIYKPSNKDITQNDSNGKIIEFPLTVLKIGNLNIPLAGGFYLRAMPFWCMKQGIKRVNRERPAVVYIHPWETYPEIPRVNVSLMSKFITYHGISNALKKFESLLRVFKFKAIKDVLDEI